MLNLPIKIVAQENSFDINSPTIIMLSGQGSSGKTTFWETYLQNKKIISMDNIANKESNWEKCLNEFFIQIQQYTNSAIKEDIVLDYSHDVIDTRRESIKYIMTPSNYNFIIIHLSLDFDLLVENDKHKRQVDSLSEEHINRIKNIYEAYQQPTLEEFKQYNFISTTIAEYTQTRADTIK